MKKKSTDMEVPRQRRYAQPDSEISPSNAIPRDSEFDLKPAMSRTHSGFDECSFESPKAGNAMWTEKDRP
jgi:hypothetical protein